MHLLAAQPGAITDGAEAVDLKQSPGDIVVLSAADTELAMLANARATITDDAFPSLRLANLMQLGHNMSVDIYMADIIAKSKLVIVRLLGGCGYWPYGVEPNRPVLDTFLRYSHEQGLAGQRWQPDDIFVESASSSYKL